MRSYRDFPPRVTLNIVWSLRQIWKCIEIWHPLTNQIWSVAGDVGLVFLILSLSSVEALKQMDLSCQYRVTGSWGEGQTSTWLMSRSRPLVRGLCVELPLQAGSKLSGSHLIYILGVWQMLLSRVIHPTVKLCHCCHWRDRAALILDTLSGHALLWRCNM